MSVKTMTSKAARLITPKPKRVPDVVSDTPMRRVVRATREWMPFSIHRPVPRRVAKARTAPDDPRSCTNRLTLSGANPTSERCTPMSATRAGTTIAALRFRSAAVPTCRSISTLSRTAKSTSRALAATTVPLKT